MLSLAFRPRVKVLIAARLLSTPCLTLLIDRTTEHPDTAPTSTRAAVATRAVPAMGNIAAASSFSLQNTAIARVSDPGEAPNRRTGRTA